MVRVTEGQMRNLFGEGLHPDADRIVADRLAAGDSPAAAARAARLGYRVQKWSGADLVFRPPGSVQVLWALGTPPVRQLIEDLQTRVTGEVLATAETELLWVRVGADSTVQRARAGVIAARFRHYENRDGQPLLHDHMVLSVKVRRQDDELATRRTRTSRCRSRTAPSPRPGPPKSPRSSTTPAAHRIHHRARAEAARRTAPARAEAQQRPPVRQQEHTPQAAPQQPLSPAPAQAPAGEASEPPRGPQDATDATPAPVRARVKRSEIGVPPPATTSVAHRQKRLQPSSFLVGQIPASQPCRPTLVMSCRARSRHTYDGTRRDGRMT
ncbi:relaxase domain-containing protein [Streptomyces sp. NPDC056227]|uniref:relaxase domain-containing protein n=1 Tax=Streptomyces sp. NPDC056227 TaxID=3345753 RepID=UPI0035E14DA7